MGLYRVDAMESLIRTELNEPNQTRITSADVLRVLNDGYKEVASRTFCIENEDNDATVSGSRLVSFKGHRVNYVTYHPDITALTLTATPSSGGGISGVWSDDFTGVDDAAVNSTKWTLGLGNSAKIKTNQCCLDPILTTYPGFGAAYLTYIKSKAPNWDNFSASIYIPTGTEMYGGAGIGWWDEGIIWGVVWGWGGAFMTFITPLGGLVFPGPPILVTTPFWMKVVKTPSSASGYYKYGTSDWILISALPTPPTTAVYIGGGTDGFDPPTRYLKKYFDDFVIDFSGTGVASVDLVWAGTATTFTVKRDGTTIYSGAGLTKTDTTVVAATTYRYEVFGYDATGIWTGYASTSVTTE
jgi:hypothetical protein